MGIHYKQIDLEERCQLRGMIEQGFSITKIAHHLGRDRRTIQRELSRNSTAKGEYKPDTASRFSWARRLRGSRCQRCSQLHETVTSSLAMGWTPQQISGWLQHKHGVAVISHETIYRYIYSPHGRQLKLSRYLPHHHAKRGYRRRKGERRIPIPDRVPIDHRPQEANDRSQLGHWEGDLVHFTSKSDILLTLQERKSRYWIMQRVPRRDSETVSNAIIDALHPFPSQLLKSITHDNGGEFAKHKAVEEKLGFLPISANRTVRGNAGQLKMETAGCVSTCRAEPNSKATRKGTSRIWPYYTTTHPENVRDTELQQKQS